MQTLQIYNTYETHSVLPENGGRYLGLTKLYYTEVDYWILYSKVVLHRK